MRKLDTLVADFPDTYSLTGQDEVSKTYSFPKSYVSYHKPRIVSKDLEKALQALEQAKQRAANKKKKQNESQQKDKTKRREEEI